METVLPPAAVVIAVAAFLLAPKLDRPAAGIGHLVGVFVPILVVLVVSLLQRDAWPEGTAFATAALVGAAGASAALLRPGIAFPVALAVSILGLTHYLPIDARDSAQLGLAFGAGLAGLLLARIGDAPALVGLSLAGLVAVDWLGARNAGVEGKHAGIAFGVLVALSLLMAETLPKKEGQRAPLGALAGLVLLGFGAWFLANTFLFTSNVWSLFAGGVAVAVVMAWALPDEEDGAFRFLVATVVWVGVATVAFALRKGYGMSISLVGATAGCLILGNRKALLGMTPLLALTIYRLFREAHPETSRALDIGQHYAIIGILVGALLPLLPFEWDRSFAKVRSVAASSALWGVLLMALPLSAAIILGAKGIVGLLVGLGLAGIAARSSGGWSLGVPAVASSLGFLLVGAYQWLSPLLDLTRDEKVRIMALTAVGIGLLVAALAALVLERRQPEASEVRS